MKFCEDVEGPETCCGSCHEDEAEGYSNLCLTDHRGEEFYVCCAQLRNLEEVAQ